MQVVGRLLSVYLDAKRLTALGSGSAPLTPDVFEKSNGGFTSNFPKVKELKQPFAEILKVQVG